MRTQEALSVIGFGGGSLSPAVNATLGTPMATGMARSEGVLRAIASSLRPHRP